ncbi:hypothetical protein [Mycoplasmopsis felis]|uniref:Uncharacterized protein n=1 Tax=Mycoplasmopsis felis TaxID=33923 RepID=A0A809SEQ8_9BACT|nr:hypothetical protein [Mycoplasmopsis felis]BBU47588.1 hypothetical protein JPM2_2810 [Mycoplasmopsis felis]
MLKEIKSNKLVWRLCTEVVSIKWFRIKDNVIILLLIFIGTINIDCSLFDAHNKNLSLLILIRVGLFFMHIDVKFDLYILFISKLFFNKYSYILVFLNQSSLFYNYLDFLEFLYMMNTSSYTNPLYKIVKTLIKVF